MSRTTARDLILEILRVKEGQWSGKTKLFKTFYFAHLYYAKDNPGLLTNWPIARMPEGPGIDQSHKLFSDLMADGLITIELDQEGPYPEYRYQLTEKRWKLERPPDDARRAIKLAADYCYPKSGTELSQLTHDKSRSWKHGKDGDIIDIYIDLIPDDEYQARKDEIERLDRQLAEIIGGGNG